MRRFEDVKNKGTKDLTQRRKERKEFFARKPL
jgi:hypothetical protein